jgi:hypothetical protein
MSDIFAAMMKQYESSHKTTSSNAKKYDLKNYFSTYLPEGVNEDTKRIRILPPEEGSSTPFTVLWGHKAQVDGDWKTFPCLKHEEDSDCPFCEAREALLATGKESDKELAKKYSARMMYVVKIIDRNKEGEGVKFWRFNHDYRKTGTMDKIMGAMKAVQHDITHPETGRDLLINIARDQNKRPVVQSISYPLESTPLNDDAEKSAEWAGDSRTWRDVYSVRTYDYLRIVVKGEIPVWDKEKEMYVSKSDQTNNNSSKEEDELDSELTMGMQTETNTTDIPVTNETVTTQEDTNSGDDEDDDLPF